ncbi:hypothetical protein BGX26_002133 [Mortierella sp. AD094]|nr:hypothetical protein BGX26_002133 [Mortierella sp. AD094]
MNQFNPADPPSRQLQAQLEWSIDYGASSHRSFRDAQEQPDSSVHELAVRPTGCSPECSTSRLERMGSPIHLSSLEPDSSDSGASSTVSSPSHCHNTKLARRNLVSNSTGHDQPTTAKALPPRRSSRLKRTRNPVEEPDMELERMERQCRINTRKRGLHEITVNLIRDATTEITKRGRYKGVQRQFLEWCKKNNHDFFTPNPVTVMSFLAASFQSQRWKLNTVDTYKSRLLQLYPGVTIFQQDPDFNNFFRVL